MPEIKTKFYNFKYVDVQYKNADVSPSVEKYRENELHKIKNVFNRIVDERELKSKRRSNRENVSGIIARYIFHNFSYKKITTASDGMFYQPLNKKKSNNIIATDINYVFYTTNGTAIAAEINMHRLFNSAVKNISDCIAKQKKPVKKAPVKKTYVKKVIGKFVDFVDESHTLKIPKPRYALLKKRYSEYCGKNGAVKKVPFECDDLIYSLLLRYNTLASLGNQWGIPIPIKNKFRKMLNIDFECFASALNHHYTHYCSAFYDIEKYFMSLGSFKNISYISGNYLSNPPYELTVLNSMVSVITTACKSKKKISFIYGTPSWAKYNKKYPFHENSLNSKYYKKHYVLADHQVLWYDFMTGKTIRIPSSTRYVLSNHDIDVNKVDDIINKWSASR
jgi:hypothetical protein